MASGDALLPASELTQAYILLDAIAATGTNDGVWVETSQMTSGIIVITGAATTAVVEVDVSNALAKPANNTHGVTHTALAAGASGQVTISSLPRWVKARISTLGTGTVTAIGHFRR